jgi:hypothetical protein
VIAALRGADLIATGPRSPQPGAPHTYATTPAFLELWGLASLRDLPDLDRLEEAGLLGTAPLGGMTDETARVHRGARWRGGVAARGVGAAAGNAGGRVHRHPIP